jgi:hypothetical protein
MTLIEDLLTENRYWTFWTPDWSKKVCIFWNGEIPFKNVIEVCKKHLGTKEVGYERQVELKEPEIIFYGNQIMKP